MRKIHRDKRNHVVWEPTGYWLVMPDHRDWVFVWCGPPWSSARGHSVRIVRVA